MKKINVVLIGLGTVGRGVYEILKTRNSYFRSKLGLDIRLTAVFDVRKDVLSKFKIPSQDKVSDVRQLIKSPSTDIVVEVIGGIHPAKEYLKLALESGKFVVTANKALLAEHGQELFSVARRFDRDIYFEAAVMGGVPIIKAIREGLVANRMQAVYGIINGTSNYVLSKMTDSGLAFNEALALARKKGYAEANPKFDIDGIDSAHKLALLTFLSFGKVVTQGKMHIEGIRHISPIDVEYAKRLGYCIKLLGISKVLNSKLEVRVHPALLSVRHPLASVSGVFNAVLLTADLVGDILLYGRGAGQFPAASAVVSDVVDAALNIKGSGGQRLPVSSFVTNAKLLPMQHIRCRYYLRFMAVDKPGVLAKISGILGRHNISIASVTQKERRHAKVVPVIILTHEAREKDIQNALAQVYRFAVIKKFPIALRIVD